MSQGDVDGRAAADGPVWRRRALLSVLLLCVVSRGGYVAYLAVVGPDAAHEADTASYLGPARALAEEGRFDRAPDDPRPEFVRTPGYPLFLAGVMTLFGSLTTPALAIQVLLSAATVLLVYVLGVRMWSAAAGLVAALLVTLEPLQFTTTGTLLTECLTALLLVAVALLGHRVLAGTEHLPRRAAGLGLALAAATMVRPGTYYLIFLAAGFVVVRLRRDRRLRERAPAVLMAFVAPVVLVVGGWQLRNHEQVGSWRVSGIEAKNTYEWRAAGVVAELDGVSLEEARTRLRAELPPVGDQGAFRGRQYQEGMAVLWAHPATTIEVTVRGLRDELFHVRDTLPRETRTERLGDVAAWVATATLVAFYTVALLGWFASLRDRRHVVAHLFVAGIAVYVLLASAGPEAYGARGERFRAPVIPLLALYAARGALEAWRSSMRVRRLALACRQAMGLA